MSIIQCVIRGITVHSWFICRAICNHPAKWWCLFNLFTCYLDQGGTRALFRSRITFQASRYQPADHVRCAGCFRVRVEAPMGQPGFFFLTSSRDLEKDRSWEICGSLKKTANVDVDVSKNRGTPKWMVYNGKPY